jgi:hypothetical protein
MAQKKDNTKTTEANLGASNEASALADIVNWSKGCPAWQRDALRRLCLHDQLDSEDIAALASLCKDGSAAVALGPEHVKDAAALARLEGK